MLPIYLNAQERLELDELVELCDNLFERCFDFERRVKTIEDLKSSVRLALMSRKLEGLRLGFNQFKEINLHEQQRKNRQIRKLSKRLEKKFKYLKKKFEKKCNSTLR